MSGATLITGGSGFVGMALAETLLRRGHDVVLFDKAPPTFRLAAPGLRFVAGDLLDAGAFDGLSGLAIGRIVHGAAVTPAGVPDADAARQIARINVGGAQAIAQFAAARGRARLYHLSSVSVYGEAATDALGRFDETGSVPSPDSLYGQTKLAAEEALSSVAAQAGFSATQLRLGPVFGPWEAAGQSRSVTSPHHQCLTDALAGHASVLPRPLVGDWLYAPDLAWMLAELLDRPSLPATLNVGAGGSTDLVQWCAALARQWPPYRWTVDAGAPSIVVRYATDRPALSTGLLNSVLPARPHTTLDRAATQWLSFCRPDGPAIKGTSTK